MRPELLQAHPQGRWRSPGAARRSREKTNRIHLGPRDRNGSLGANVVGERHALPRSCTTFSGGRAFTNTYPLWIVLLSLRRLSRGEIGIDLLRVVSGVVLIQRPYLSGKGDLAVLVALLASFTTAVAMLGLHRLRTVDACAVVAHFSGLASLVLSLWVFVHPRIASASTFDATTLLMLLGVGLTGTMGQVLITKAFASGPPSRISVLSLSQVVFAMAFDMTLGGRVLTPQPCWGSFSS